MCIFTLSFVSVSFVIVRCYQSSPPHFLIDQILIDENKLILNGKRAQEQRIGQFWQELLTYDEEGTL